MFDWSNYLGLAEQLATSADEASWRSAISRAYYAAYGIACTHVSQPRLKDEGSHEAVWNAFVDRTKQTNPSNDVMIRRDGLRLKQLRKQADYTASPAMTQKEASEALRLSQKLKTALERRTPTVLAQSQPPQAVVPGSPAL